MTDPILNALRPQPTGGLIVTFHEGVELSDQVAVLENAAGRGVKSLSSRDEGTAEFDAATPALVLEDIGIALVSDRIETQGVHATLGAHAKTRQVRPEYRVYSAGTLDHSFERTRGIAATGAEYSPHTGRGIKLCVLDSGLDEGHPDFQDRRITSRGFTSGGVTHDGFGHGTMCAGIACGRTQFAEFPRYGVASEAELFVGKVLDDSGGELERNVLTGLLWAIREGGEVISLSPGTPVQPRESFDAHYQRLGRLALDKGLVVVSAAGNNSRRDAGVIAPVCSPANAPSIMSVAAVTQKLAVAEFSCGGVNGEDGAVDLAAPGVNVFSSMMRQRTYISYFGTSLACPYVSGVAALWADSDPALRGAALWKRLTDSATDIRQPYRDVGHGLVQAPAAAAQ
jgi:subtilisin family serine protease